MKILLLAAVLLVGMVGSRCLAGDATPLPTTAPSGISADLWRRMAGIDRAASQIEDLTADFVQRKFTPLLKQPMASGGTVWARGAVMLWETRGDTPTVMRTDASEVKIYYPLQKTVEVYPLSGELAQIAASPVPRLAELLKSFRFAPGAMGEWKVGTGAPGLAAFRLTPTNAEVAQHVETVDVLIDAEHGFILGFRLTDADGERTELQFEHVKINTHFDDAKLRLDVPGDVKVVHPLENMGAGQP